MFDRFPFLRTLRVPWLMAAGAALCMALVAVWWGGLNQDEGWYLYAAQMVSAGKLPYRDFFFTQGPAMPFVYSLFAPVWGLDSPLHGLLGGRAVTWLLGTLATLMLGAFVRFIVPPANRRAAALGVFALLACNLYHVYFTTIPKTYALGSLFVAAGFLLLAHGLKREGIGRGTYAFLGGLALAFASGTRISLILLLPAVGFTLLAFFRQFRWTFVGFGLGGFLGLFLTYGFFTLDPASCKALLAAQAYHAGRGGFDPFFSLGSVSRLARGYAALGAILMAMALWQRKPAEPSGEGGGDAVARSLRWMLGAGFAAVFLLQLSAPFPYDDYQVPVMGILTVLIASWFFGPRCTRPLGAAWFAVLVSGMVSFCSPLLQEWATYNQDRFWSQKKECTELAKLRDAARALNELDPGGKTLLTQDLYLAVESGRTVPTGLEMGPFSYFPGMPAAEARAVCVLDRSGMEELLAGAEPSAAATSGYAFAIAVPKCDEVPAEDQARYRAMLESHYEPVLKVPNFGQGATVLTLYRRKGAAHGSGSARSAR